MRQSAWYVMGLGKVGLYGQRQWSHHPASFPPALPLPEGCGSSTSPSSRKRSQLRSLNGVVISTMDSIWPQMIEAQVWASKPAPSEPFPGGFADTNRGRDKPLGHTASWWQSWEILGPEAAGGFIFTTWKRPLGENSASHRSCVERSSDRRRRASEGITSLSRCASGLPIL